MSNGFNLGKLQAMEEVNKGATPQFKVEPYGLLASLYTAHSLGVIEHMPAPGHKQSVTIKAKKRLTPDEVADDPSCEVTNTRPYYENSVAVNNFKQYAFHIEDETIAQFEAYASKNVKAPGSAPVTDLMFEYYHTLQTVCSGILSAVNQDLWVLALAGIGNNRRTGNANAANLNFTQDTTLNVLTAGANQIKRDFRFNNMMGAHIAVGGGLFHNWILQQPASTPTQGGIDSRIQAAGFDFFQDEDLDIVASASNRLVVYEKDAIQLVEYMKYTGFKAGTRGTSTFGTFALPFMVADQKVPVKFDFQLRFNDCPETLAYVDGEESVELQPGYNMIVSKNYGLWTIPSTAYANSDVLTGNRGNLYYTITNT